jgi:predicted MFS family arabinose efflux permease
MLPQTGPKIYLAASIAAFAVVAGLAALLLHEEKYLEKHPRAVAGNAFMATMTLEVWLTALAFGVYVVSSVGFFTFMPAYAGERDGLLLSAGAVALAVPVGNVLAGILVRGRGLRFIVLLSGAGFLANVALAIPGFTASDPAFATLALVAYAIAGGVIASALFAAVPFIVPRSGSASVAIGLIAQAGGLGTLFGPPLAGHVIENYGFDGFGMLLAMVSLAGAAVLMPLTLAKARRDSLPRTQQ